MYGFLKKCSFVLAAILAVQLFSFSSIGTYAQSPGDKESKTVYITLDDGPSWSTTPKNLDTLKKYGIKATFFVTPHSGMDALYKRIIEEGHDIGNHSYSHDFTNLYSSTEYFRADVLKAGDYIFEKTGCNPTVYRFPGGTMGWSGSVIKPRTEILAALGYDYCDWNVSTADTDPNLRAYGTEEYIVSLLTNNVLYNTGDREKLIVLMHDTSGYSAKALPRIIEGLQRQGYVFGVLTKDADWQYELSENGEAVITGYIGDDTAVAVPPTLDGHAVTAMGSDIFTDDSIENISIPSDVVNIDSGAFWECRTLESINVADDNPKYTSTDGVAFSDGGTVLFHYPAGKIQSSGTYTVPQGVLTIGRSAFDHNQTLKSIALSSSVTRIEDAAFWRCSALKTFEVTAGVAEIGSSVFSNCSELSAISVVPGNSSYISTDGVLFDLSGTRLIQYPAGKSGSYTVPAGVEIIGEGAFRGSNGLQQVILSDSVSRLENTAFAYCESLTDVKLGNGLLSIGYMAFQTCSSLPSIVIPESLEAVETMAFESCSSLTDVYFLGDMPDFGDNVFGSTSGEFAVDYLESRGESWSDYTSYPLKPFTQTPFFNDVASGAWYREAVNFIAERGITTGVGSGGFGPQTKLTRGQFIVMLMRAYGIEPDVDAADNFADAGSSYYTGYLAAAKRLGISNGVGENLFAPEKQITRQEMFTLLYHALQLIEDLPLGASGKTLADFTDAGQIDPWAEEAMALLVETGAVGGSDGALNPRGTTTRAEMAQVLFNLLGK